MVITLFLILKTGTQNWTPYKLEKIGDGAFRDCESLNDSFLASYFKRKEEKKIEEKRLKEEKLEAER